jgi:hypothetical protein
MRHVEQHQSSATIRKRPTALDYRHADCARVAHEFTAPPSVPPKMHPEFAGR